jgi:flagellar biosynthesis/type III secretory pathway M-ring protein FliF/YscJ
MQLPKPVLYGMGGGLALVALLMGGLYMRRAKQKKKQLAAQTLVEQASKALEGPDADGKALADFEGAKKNFEDKLVEQSALKEQQEAMALAALRLPTVTTQKAEVLTKHLTAEAKKDPQAMAHIIKVWLNER